MGILNPIKLIRYKGVSQRQGELQRGQSVVQAD